MAKARSFIFSLSAQTNEAPALPCESIGLSLGTTKTCFPTLPSKKPKKLPKQQEKINRPPLKLIRFFLYS